MHINLNERDSVARGVVARTSILIGDAVHLITLTIKLRKHPSNST